MTQDPKPSTFRDEPYKLWARTQLCDNCGNPPSEYLSVVPAHPTGGGVANKEDDRLITFLCVYCHAIEHKGFHTFWGMYSFDHDGETREDLVREHRARYKEETTAPETPEPEEHLQD